MADDPMQMRPIGHLHSVFRFKNGTPRQPSLCRAARGSVTVDKSIFNNPEHALDGLEQFSHAWIMFVFHKNQPGHTKAKVKPPRLNGKRVGVFSTRSPYRPNAIGLTLARIERISGATIYFSGIDIIDGTPVLDIKPFIPQYDVPECRSESVVEDYHCCESHTLGLDTHPGDSGMEGGVNRPGSGQSGSQCSAAVANNDHDNDDCGEDVSRAGEAKCDHVENSPLLAPELSFNPLTEELLSAEHNPVSGDHSSILSSDRICLQTSEEKRHPDHQDCTREHPTYLSEETLDTAEQEQSSASLPHPQTRARDCLPSATTVAVWLSDPPVTMLQVSFTPKAESQLQKFKTLNRSDTDYQHRLEFLSGVEELRAAIVSVLAEDPRSVYRREKCVDSLYFFTVDQVHITCWFDDKGNCAEVVRLQPVSCVEKLLMKGM